MSNKVIIKKQPILFNSIDEQRLSYANQLTVKSWNDIINILRVQTNTNTAYIKQLHNWLVGNTGEDITIPETDMSFVEYVLSGSQAFERLDVKNLYINGKKAAIEEDIPTKVSQLENDSNYAVKTEVVDLTSNQNITGSKTFSAPVHWNADSLGNTSEPLQFILGIKAFVDGGTTHWQNVQEFFNSNIPKLDVQDTGNYRWTNREFDSKVVITSNTLAYWDGSHTDSHYSNLKYGVGGELAFKSDIDNVMQVAEGKTKTYVIKAADNDWFNSNMDEITVVFNSLQLITVDGTYVNPKDLKIGDIILVKELDVPDRYVGNKIASNIIKFYKMETSKVDLDVKQDTLVSGKNIKTIDGKSLLGNGDITTYNLIYSNAGPTDTIQDVITQIKKYLNITGNEGYYNYVGHIRYTGYKEYLNGYIDLQVTNGGTLIVVRYNDMINQKHCSIGGDYVEIASMSIDNFLNTYMVPNSPTKTSQLENDSDYATTPELENYLPLDGSKSMTGDLDMNYHDINNVNSLKVHDNIKVHKLVLSNNALISPGSETNYKDIKILALGPDDSNLTSGTIHIGTTLPKIGEYSWTSTFTFDIPKSALYSSSGTSLSLGLSDKQWYKVYSKQIYQDGKQVANKEDVPTKVSQLENDSGFLTEHQDISGKVDRTELNDYETKGSTGATLDASIDNTTYVMTLKLCNSYGNIISTGTVDLPLETMVISARYEDGKLYLTTKDGNELEGIDISNIVSGLVPNTRTINGKALSNDIVLNKADIGLSNVDNTSDVDKPVSTATAAALALKANETELNKYALRTSVPTKTSQLENDSGYINQHQDISGKADKTELVNYILYTTDNPKNIYWEGTLNTLEFDIESVQPSIKFSGDRTGSATITPNKIELNGNSESGSASILLDDKPVALQEEIPTKTSELTNDSNFLTEHQDLSGYLPLSAGEDKSLTNDLYIQDGTTEKSIFLGDGPQFRANSNKGLIISASTGLYFRKTTTGSTGSVTLQNSSFRPETNNDVFLGTSQLQWKELYSSKIYQDGKQVANQEDIPTKVSQLENDSNYTTQDDLNNVIEIAEGKTKTYVIEASVNSYFMTTSQEPLSISNSNELTIVDGTKLPFTDLNKGDIILLTDTDLPDRFVGNVGEQIVFYPLESRKMDLDNYALKSEIPTKVSQLTNDSGFLTEHQDLSGYLPLSAGSDKALTGQLSVLESSSIWAKDAGIKFGSNQYITANANGELGIQVGTGIYFRIGDTNKLLIRTNEIRPGVNKSLNLGTSSYQWNNIYGNQIYQNGKQVANQEDIPTKVSDLTNDSNYVTISQIFEIGSVGQTTPSDNLAVGGLFFQEI